MTKQTAPAVIGLLPLLLSGCAFNGNAPLPRPAAIEAMTPSRAPDALADVIARADVLYLPADRVETDEDGAAGVRIVAALRRAGAPFAVAWQTIDASQQASLDAWAGDHSPGESSIDEIKLRVLPGEQEECRRLLHHLRGEKVTLLALNLPGNEGQGHEYDFAADKIASYLQQHRNGKLLVIVERRDTNPAMGIPAYVSRRCAARQIVLDAVATGKPRPVLAWWSRGSL